MSNMIGSMSDANLLMIWRSLKTYDPKEYYDTKNGITMDDWATSVLSEIEHRRLDWRADEEEHRQPTTFVSTDPLERRYGPAGIFSTDSQLSE